MINTIYKLIQKYVKRKTSEKEMIANSRQWVQPHCPHDTDKYPLHVLGSTNL